MYQESALHYGRCFYTLSRRTIKSIFAYIIRPLITRQSKVERLIDEYEFEGIGSELEERWTQDENRWNL